MRYATKYNIYYALVWSVSTAIETFSTVQDINLLFLPKQALDKRSPKGLSCPYSVYFLDRKCLYEYMDDVYSFIGIPKEVLGNDYSENQPNHFYWE